MKSLSPNPKYKIFLHVILILAVIFILNFHPKSIKAQEGLEPQLVTATYYNSDCFPAGSDFRIEIYNVGSQGGEAYSQAVYVYAITHIGNHPDGGIACFVDGYGELYGTFTGGPDGTITFPPDNLRNITTCQVMDGKTIECKYVYELYDLGVSEYTTVFIIQNPEAFQPALPTEPTATAGVGCTPSVRGLDPARPGDVISPGASYVDATGKETGVIQDRWFFNGIESSSIVWDGNPVTVELQWTCLDHLGYSKTFSIPAYQESSVQSGNEPGSGNPADNPGSSESQGEPKNVSPLGFIALIGGALGVLGAVGVGIVLLLIPKAPVPPAPLPSSPPSPVTPVNYPPPSRPVQTIPPTQTKPPLTSQPARPAGLTNAQRMELTNIRGQMENEVVDLKSKWRANRDAVEKLKELLQKDLLKFSRWFQIFSATRSLITSSGLR